MIRRKTSLALAGATTLAVLGASISLQAQAQADSIQAPRFEVDPMWPKPLPNHWVLGSTIGVGVDARDHVFIIHRGAMTLNRNENGAALSPKIADCCVAAPPVLEFDPEGNLVNAWGGPGQGYKWPNSNHGITIDDKGDVWIGGNGEGDSHILRFTHDGKFVAQYGIDGRAPDSNARDHFGRVAKITFHLPTREAFVADGYGNRRVAVLNMDTGALKRFWGAYGAAPSDAAQAPYSEGAPLEKQFRNPVHCADPSKDGLVYVCDRVNNRIQVFKLDGTFVKEARVSPSTLGAGSVWDMAFSRDPGQKYIYASDGQNARINVIHRASLQVLTSFGDGGRQPGQFYGVHSIATDSKGNLYTTETYEGKRVQKFVFKGIGAVPRNQGTVWPKK